MASMAFRRLLATGGTLPRILVALHFTVLLTWLYKRIRPPNSKTSGTIHAPSLTASRIRLKDGRHLAYMESGISKEFAKFKVIFVHGFGGCRYTAPKFSQNIIEELGIYILSFDRAGYGQSDPNANRNIKSDAHDVEELADQLELGERFFLMVESIGGYTGWGCLKYIPQRLAGVAMIAPATNFWWPGISESEFKEAFNSQVAGDRWFLRVTHHAPWLAYWWMTQQWFPTSSAVQGRLDVLNSSDQEAISKFNMPEVKKMREEAVQQGVYESLYRDALIMFGKWEFDPGELENPFTGDRASVHIWQGDEDYLVPVVLQRYVSRKLHWANYHEIKGKGHLLLASVDGLCDHILRILLLGEQSAFE